MGGMDLEERCRRRMQLCRALVHLSRARARSLGVKACGHGFCLSFASGFLRLLGVFQFSHKSDSNPRSTVRLQGSGKTYMRGSPGCSDGT